MMNRVNWGIIGVGDVTEVKSGPAFNKVENSQLLMVMRRNLDKAKETQVVEFGRGARILDRYSNYNRIVLWPIGSKDPLLYWIQIRPPLFRKLAC